MSYPGLIGLGGHLRAGKDAVADYLEEKYGYKKMGMSDPLNAALLTLNPWVRLDFPITDPAPWTSQRYRGHYHAGEYTRYQDLHDAVGYVEAKRHTDVRTYLQLLGTEVGRNMIGPDVWVDAARKKIRRNILDDTPTVITALRFPNELVMLEKLGGVTVWIDRPGEEVQQSHASESSVSEQDFKYTLHNGGSLEELYAAADGLIDYAHLAPVDGTVGEKTASAFGRVCECSTPYDH